MEPTRYRISVRGQLTQRLAAAFEGMSLEAGNGKTVLAGEIRDQCHLYGVLDQVRNLGLDLVAVESGAMTVQADSEITGERRVYWRRRPGRRARRGPLGGRRVSLRGRSKQSAAVDRLPADVRAGRGRALVIRGEPGIGKTALLGYAADSAAGELTRTLNPARGLSAESTPEWESLCLSR